MVAAQAQEGLEEPLHVEGQEGRREEIPVIQGKEQRLCFAGAAVKRYPMPEARAATGRSNPMSKEWCLCLEEPSHTEGQEGWWEEIPLIQDKEQWLCFAGAAVKIYPCSR